jgi:hypothetical protein
MKEFWAKCPLCGAGIKRVLLKYGKPFPCPECKRLLFAPLHAGAFAIVGGLAAGLLVYALGARGWWLVVITCLLIVPGLMVFSGLWTLFVPPSLRPFTSDPDHNPNGLVRHDLPDRERDETAGGHTEEEQTARTN